MLLGLAPRNPDWASPLCPSPPSPSDPTANVNTPTSSARRMACPLFDGPFDPGLVKGRNHTSARFPVKAGFPPGPDICYRPRPRAGTRTGAFLEIALDRVVAVAIPAPPFCAQSANRKHGEGTLPPPPA